MQPERTASEKIESFVVRWQFPPILLLIGKKTLERSSIFPRKRKRSVLQWVIFSSVQSSRHKDARLLIVIAGDIEGYLLR
ncbi:hypothetical protein CHARACLAT_005271 [Characodon lateralis]|uniref:Uncharacterized protein n=1 Tax=Characodon lateralis TaxID=208331 RepID=A0ABU7E776_9TELE|nr:hypothetical protein [Characodon lateralis]